MGVAERELQRRNYLQNQYEIPEKSIEKQEQKSKANYKLKYIIKLFCIVLLALLPLYRFAVITETQDRINKLQIEAKELEAQNEQLKVEVANLKSIKRIEEIARGKLSMKEPESYQIFYLNTD